MVGLALGLFVLAGVLLLVGIGTLLMAPLMASRVAASTSRPTLERRASGPDRMRNIINSQITERKRTSSFSVALTRTGTVLAALAALALISGAVAWFAGY